MKFGDVVRHGIYHPPSLAHYDSDWYCMVIDQWLMVTISGAVSPIPMYEAGKPFRWSMKEPEKVWRQVLIGGK